MNYLYYFVFILNNNNNNKILFLYIINIFSSSLMKNDFHSLFVGRSYHSLVVWKITNPVSLIVRGKIVPQLGGLEVATNLVSSTEPKLILVPQDARKARFV